MASTIYGEDHLADKSPNKNPPTFDVVHNPVHPEIVSNELISPDQQVALFATIDATGSATLGECMAALQPHNRPVAALIALAEEGLIAFDRDGEFDEHLTVWRIR